MKKIAVVTIAVVLVALGVFWIQRDSDPKGEEPFRIAFNTWIGYSPLVIAKEKGYLDEAGLDVEITFLEDIGSKNSALLRGDIDGVGHTADSAVTSAAAGVDGQVVFVFDQSLGADAILVKKHIESIEGLRGRKVALEPGFTGHFFFLYLLEEAGMLPNDVEIVEMDTGSAGGAFVGGSVEAAVTWEPWIGKAKDLDDTRVLFTSADRPGVIIDVLFMLRETIDERPDDVETLVAAIGRATDWYLENVEEGNQILAKFWKLDIKEVRDTVAGMQFMRIKENAEFFGTVAQPGKLQHVIERADALWRKAGVTEKPVTASGLVDFKSLNAAASRGN